MPRENNNSASTPEPFYRLDLHGYASFEVRSAISNAIRNAKQESYKALLIIYGRGIHSYSGKSTLRRPVAEELERHHLTERSVEISNGGAKIVNLYEEDGRPDKKLRAIANIRKRRGS